MKIRLNGDWREYDAGISLDQLLDIEGVRREYMAVERNKKVVRKQTFTATILEDGDQIEIVKLVGGG